MFPFSGFQYSSEFVYSLKTSDNQSFSNFFRGYGNAVEYWKALK